MCPLLSLDSHNVIYCCKFSCSDWFFLYLSNKAFSGFRLALVYGQRFGVCIDFFQGRVSLACHPSGVQLDAVLRVSAVFLGGGLFVSAEPPARPGPSHDV